jgi:hypothetical protein
MNKKKIIMDSSNSYYINQNNEFFDHFEKYKNVMNELKNENTINLCKSDLKSIIQNINERKNYIEKTNFDYISQNDINKLNYLKDRLGYENMSNVYLNIVENNSNLLIDIKNQIDNLRNNKLVSNNEDIERLVNNIGNCLQYLSFSDLDFFKKIVENNEVFSLLTLEPILISKIGVTILLKNWVYLHIPENFNIILKKCYETNIIIIEKMNKNINKSILFNEKYVFNRFDISWTRKKIIIGSVGFAGLFSTYYWNNLTRNKTILESNNGFNGLLGNIFKNFRDVSGRLAYEVAYSLSHFSNQAIIGAIVPKKEVIQDIFKNYKKW